MRLTELELKNIRSYGSARVSFADGITLFEGDIGSGKSTLLYAIEFALFGLGDLESDFLLRHGASEGSVRLAFEVGGGKYEVFRSLQRKRGSVQQGSAWITEGGVKKEYSPSEMKPRVLSILGFNEPPSPRATSWIYRYAIFTPQEEMKRVLELREEERMQTLRKAFGIEEYRIARDNAGVVVKWIREQEKFLEGETRDLESIEARIGELGEKESELGEKKARWQQSIELIERALGEEKNALAQSRQKIAVLEKISGEVPLLERQVVEKKREIKKIEDEAKKAGNERLPYETELNDLMQKKIEPARSEAIVKKELREKKAVAEKLAGEVAALSAKAIEYEELVKKKVCPTCEQEIPETDFSKKIGALHSVLNEKNSSLNEFKKEIEGLEKELERFKESEAIEKRKNELRDWLEKNYSMLRGLEEKRRELEKSIESIEKELSEKKGELAKSAEAKKAVEEAAERVEEKEKELRSALKEKSWVEAELGALLKQKTELLKQAEEKRAKKTRLQEFQEKRVWLTEFFAAALAAIEQSVLVSINAEFNELFQKYFALLIEFGDLSVRVDEAFTPLVTQNGYEQDYRALSGGEKSALALAYRLALNAIVRTVCASMKENLLILDEPTDGFSKEQLSKVRDVLDEVACEQVLLVSHERELEAFADRVMRVIKEGSESRIET